MFRAAYFDTSVLAKTYVRENGSATAQRLVRGWQIITSSITGLELVSAFRRNLTSGSIDQKAHAAIMKRFLQHREKWRHVELTAASLEFAEKYVSAFDVRTLDAIHIASAVISGRSFPKNLPFVTADSQQRAVATELGLDVIWVKD